MTTYQWTRVMLRRWPLVLLGIILTLVAARVVATPTVVYWTDAKVRLVPPTKAKVNSLTAGSGSLISLAGLLTVEANRGPQPLRFSNDSVTIIDAGTYEGRLIRLPNTGGQWVTNFEEPAVDVQVSSEDPQVVRQGVQEILAGLSTRLDDIQESYGVPASQRVTLLTVMLPDIRESRSSRLRALAGTLVVGVGLTLGAVPYADQILLRRRNRSKDRTPEEREQGSRASVPTDSLV